METLSQSKSVLDGYTCLVPIMECWENFSNLVPGILGPGISTQLSGSVVCVVLSTGVTNFVELPGHGSVTELLINSPRP